MRREPSEQRLRAVAAQHKPRGWFVNERAPVRVGKGDDAYLVEGLASFEYKRIDCPPLVTREALLVFLHECGHVVCKHYLDDWSRIPVWLQEYEAETWAIKALRSAGMNVPKSYTESSAKHIRDHLEESHEDTDVPDEVLKFAYGKDWRKHK